MILHLIGLKPCLECPIGKGFCRHVNRGNSLFWIRIWLDMSGRFGSFLEDILQLHLQTTISIDHGISWNIFLMSMYLLFEMINSYLAIPRAKCDDRWYLIHIYIHILYIFIPRPGGSFPVRALSSTIGWPCSSVVLESHCWARGEPEKIRWCQQQIKVEVLYPWFDLLNVTCVSLCPTM